MESITADTDNTTKWSSIELTLQSLFHKPKNETLNKSLFEVPLEASQKFDGTNVGKDANGLMYGRNKMIPATSQSYQKTKLDQIKKTEVKPVLDEFNNICGTQVEHFVLYGELMCNAGLYNYKEFESYHVFGAMIKVNESQYYEAVEKIRGAGFACRARKQTQSSGEDEDEGADGDWKMMITMNQTFKNLIDKFNYPTVPFLGKFESFYDLVTKNYEWMVKGMGEGLILVQGNFITKWKIGAEANQTNLDLIRKMLDLIEDDKEVFGENTEKASELMNKLYEIQKSNLIMGEPPKPKVKEPKAKKEGPKKPAKIELTEEQAAAYAEAIKSAKTKFDHADTYFAKNMKGVEAYAKLISDECLNDITPEDATVHFNIVKDQIKQEFIEYNKAKKAAK